MVYGQCVAGMTTDFGWLFNKAFYHYQPKESEREKNEMMKKCLLKQWFRSLLVMSIQHTIQKSVLFLQDMKYFIKGEKKQALYQLNWHKDKKQIELYFIFFSHPYLYVYDVYFFFHFTEGMFIRTQPPSVILLIPNLD